MITIKNLQLLEQHLEYTRKKEETLQKEKNKLLNQQEENMKTLLMVDRREKIHHYLKYLYGTNFAFLFSILPMYLFAPQFLVAIYFSTASLSVASLLARALEISYPLPEGYAILKRKDKKLYRQNLIQQAFYQDSLMDEINRKIELYQSLESQYALKYATFSNQISGLLNSYLEEKVSYRDIHLEGDSPLFLSSSKKLCKKI